MREWQGGLRLGQGGAWLGLKTLRLSIALCTKCHTMGGRGAQEGWTSDLGAQAPATSGYTPETSIHGQVKEQVNELNQNIQWWTFTNLFLSCGQSYLFNFFSTFWRFWHQKDAHILLITLVKFYSWNMLRLEDINENVSGYGNHNQAEASTQ